MTPKKSKSKEPLCPRCINWDPRPEEGLSLRSAYCIAREIVTAYRYECEYFEMATDALRQKRNREIYGEYPNDEGHFDSVNQID